MASEPNAEDSPPSVLQSVSGRVARLGGIFALALFEVNARSEGPPKIVASYGPVSWAGFSLFYSSLQDPLSSAQLQALGIDSNHFEGRGFRTRDEASGEETGMLVILIPHPSANSELANLAIELLRDLARQESRRERELHAQQALAAKHIEARERENQRLASELHDRLSQTLTVIRLSLAAMQRRAPSAVVRAEFAELATLTSEAGTSLRDLITRLRPPLLETVGLAAAIRNEATLRYSGAPIQCDLDEFTISSGVALAAFRIAQEALANAAAHSKATSIRVELHREDGDAFRLSILDNGCGFDAFAARRSSPGLLELEQRAKMAGGRIAIESSPGSGAHIQAWFPIKGGAAKE